MASSLITIVDFHDDPIFTIQREDGVFVAIKPIVDAIGLDWSAQKRRLARDTILAEGRVIITLPSLGGPQETVCLRLELVHGWLFTIDDGHIRRPDVLAKVLTYKRECYRVLFEHFHGKAQATAEELAEMRISDDAKVRQVTETRLTFGHAAAARLWIKLGLPVVPEMLRDPRIGDLFDETTLTLGGMQ